MWYEPSSVIVEAEAISLAEAKAQVNVEVGDDATDFDGLLARLIAAARGFAERYCSIAIPPQTIVRACDGFSDFAHLPVAPISAVSISYIDPAGDEQTLEDTIFALRADGLEPSIVLKPGQTWPLRAHGSRLTVTFTAGSEDVPDDIRHAMLLLIAHWFVNREAGARDEASPLPFGVEALLVNHRR